MAAEEDGVAEAAAEAAPGAPTGDEPSGVVPGQVTPEELWTLYQASEIKVRSITEQRDAATRQNEAWVIATGGVMQELGVDQFSDVLPAIRELKKNRQQRRSRAPRARR